MRIPLLAAAVLLSFSTAHAQDRGKPAAPALTPSATLVEQLKAAGELKDSKTLEAPAPKLDSLQPARSEPAIASEPQAASRPAETSTPAAASTPAASPPAAAKPTDPKPAQVAAETKSPSRRVVRKPETRERKARRIAAKYGVYW